MHTYIYPPPPKTKVRYPRKINGWKMTFSFEMFPFWGHVDHFFLGGSTRAAQHYAWLGNQVKMDPYAAT